MSLFTGFQKFGYTAANRLLTLQASTTTVSNPGVDEVQIVTGGTVPELKIYTGGQWKFVTRAHLCVRTDTDSNLAGTYTYTKTTGAVQKFDNGNAYLTVHDTGGAALNLKSNVNESHQVIAGTGGSYIALQEAGGIKLAATAVTAGNTFTDDYYINISSTGIESKAKNSGGTLRNMLTASPTTLIASSDCFLKSNPYSAISIAVNEIKIITEYPRSTTGDIYIKASGKMAKLLTCSSSATSIDRQGDGTLFNLTKDNAGTINVYFGSSYLEVQNKTAGAVTVTLGGYTI